MNWFSYLFLLFGLSWTCVGMYRWYANDKGMLDHPSLRSSHTVPTPRGGGAIFFLGWCITLAALVYFGVVRYEFLIYFSPAVVIGLLGFWDDHKNLSASFRFFVQTLTAIATLFLLNEGGYLVAPWFPSIPLPLCFLGLAFGVVWIINLFNFMDGSDGIATSEGLFVFGVGGFILFQYPDPIAYQMATLAWSLCALLAGFLMWNWPTARIFMGDSGSCFLGIMVALFALISNKLFNLPFMIWVILTALFWFDATITLVRRILAGEEWRKPHRKHAYQRLIQAGWSHQTVLLCTIGVNAALSVMAFMAFKEPRLTSFMFGLALTLLICLYLLVEIVKPMFRQWHEGAKTVSEIL